MTSPNDFRARVFISCGQAKHTDEPAIADAIAKELTDLGFDFYIAVQEQTLSGLKENIFRKLRESEYFLFVDFKRRVADPRSRRTPWVAHPCGYCKGGTGFRGLFPRAAS